LWSITLQDIIVFHPYDGGHWGFDCMGGDDPASYNTTLDNHYLKYMAARFAAFDNVWWASVPEQPACYDMTCHAMRVAHAIIVCMTDSPLLSSPLLFSLLTDSGVACAWVMHIYTNSMANEWSDCRCKSLGMENGANTSHDNGFAPTWDELFRTLAKADPYGRQTSIHNGPLLYNHSIDVRYDTIRYDTIRFDSCPHTRPHACISR
jgi:hypothetical protein